MTAASPAEALASAARQSLAIDLLVTDVVMPGMNGGELADKLVAMRPGLRVLFITGYDDEEVTTRGLLGPGRECLSKPFTPAQLRARCSALVQQTQLNCVIPNLQSAICNRQYNLPHGPAHRRGRLHFRRLPSHTADEHRRSARPGDDRPVGAPDHLADAETPDRLGQHGHRHARRDGHRMAEEGGLGIIDRGFRPGDIEPQVREVMKVKRTQHGVIPDPLTIAPEARWPMRAP